MGPQKHYDNPLSAIKDLPGLVGGELTSKVLDPSHKNANHQTTAAAATTNEKKDTPQEGRRGAVEIGAAPKKEAPPQNAAAAAPPAPTVRGKRSAINYWQEQKQQNNFS